MIKKYDTFENINIDNSLLGINDLSKALFIDIETTGLSARNSSIYLIGLTSLIDGKWTFTGLFAENPADEINILNSLIDIIKDFDTLIHFNGARFDLPFITERAKANGIDICFDEFESIDLLKRIKSFKHLLGIGNCRQKTIEAFLGINREDQYDGGQLIIVYKEYVETKDEEHFSLLYQHNHDDLLGMLEILPVFTYEELSNIKPRINNISENEYTGYNGECCLELMCEYTLPFALPAPISINAEGVFLSIKNNIGYLRMPLKYDEMKHFLANYKDYYYLPQEDIVVHKSVASSVDKEYRRNATKENCYLKKSGIFLPYFGSEATTTFKKCLSDKIEYIELTKAFIDCNENLETYFHDFLCCAYKKKN